MEREKTFISIYIIKNKNFYISLLCLVLIVVFSVITGLRNYHENINLVQRIYPDNENVLGLVSPHKEWVGLSSQNFFSSLYYFLFPLLISVALADSIYAEKSSRNISYQLTRINRKIYYWRKFLFTYISSFLLFIIPLIFGVILVNFFSDTWDYSFYSNMYKRLINGTVEFSDNVFQGDKKDIFSSLLSVSPYVYIFVYYIMGGLFASGYVCIGLASSLVIKNRYFVILFPQIIYTVSWALFTILGKLNWDPFNFLDPKQPVEGLSYGPIFIAFLLQLFVAFGLYVYGVKKNDDVF
ncbi:NADH dehydrogenase FAD-containing subunit [Anoxybacillus sp. TBDG-1]